MSKHKQRVVWVGSSRDGEVAQLLEALKRESFEVESVGSSAGLSRVTEESVPKALLLDATTEGAAEACLSIRMQARMSSVPILWITNKLDDLVFAEAYAVGGDDVAKHWRHEGIVRRLKLLPNVAMKPPSGRGVALVAEADDQRRVVLARLLSNAGFDLSFASDVAELYHRLQTDGLALVMAELDLPGGGALPVLLSSRAEGSTVPWILATPPKKLRETSEVLKGTESSWVWDSYAPPENVLYAANEALRGSVADQRASLRLLYGTTIAFRVAGRDRDDHGFLYNVSGEGVFVRTLAPLPPGDDVWLEFKPPRTDRRVRLEARVVWRRMFGPAAEATVPPGFGARIVGGSQTDVMRYRDGYRALTEDFAGIRFSAHPSAAPEEDVG